MKLNISQRISLGCQCSILFLFFVFCCNVSAQENRSADCTGSHVEYVSTHDYNNFEHGDWVLIFEDDFEENFLDTTKWYTCEDGWNRFHGTCGSELQCYLDNNIVIENGILKLVAKVDSTGIPRPECNLVLPYSSGWIQSKTKFKYGLIEAKCKVPYGRGFWPAFWLFGHTSEIDIFEIYGNESNKIHTDMHRWYGNQDTHCPLENYKNGLYEDYYVFRIEWDEFKIEYSVGDDIIRTQYKYTNQLGQPLTDRFDYTNSSNMIFALNIFPDSLQSIIFNLAISNSTNHPCPDNNTPFPSSLDIDYIRIYKRNNKNKDWSISSYDPNKVNYLTGRNITSSSNTEIAIQEGNYLNCIATNDIILQPNFTAEHGCEFQATIIPASRKKTEQENLHYKEDSLGNDKNLIEEDAILQVFPNPSNGFFTFELVDKTSTIKDIIVEDSKGNSVLKKTNIDKFQYSIKIETSGLYYARIRTNDFTFLKKLIVK